MIFQHSGRHRRRVTVVFPAPVPFGNGTDEIGTAQAIGIH
jgi:hypothetical protein